jgi:hypothetical protein
MSRYSRTADSAATKSPIVVMIRPYATSARIRVVVCRELAASARESQYRPSCNRPRPYQV